MMGPFCHAWKQRKRFYGEKMQDGRMEFRSPERRLRMKNSKHGAAFCRSLPAILSKKEYMSAFQ